MYLCYLDESGVPENASTSHFVLIGLAIPATDWKQLDNRIRSRKLRYDLADEEIHSAWMARRYVEQERVPSFATLSRHDRRLAVEPLRQQHLLRLAASGTRKQLEAAKKNYRKTSPYIHLTLDERLALLRELADTPLFVDSQLTSMVQIADLCGYATRRYFENNETDLFDRIYSRFDRTPQGVVGIRHFTAQGCTCQVCTDH